MIAGPYVKAQLQTDLAATGTEFEFVDNDTEWAPKLWMFLDASLIEATTSFEQGDACGTALRDMRETSQIYLYAVSVAGDDAATTAAVELEVRHFVALVIQTIAADQTLGLTIPGVDWLRVRVVSNETSTRQMQDGAGGQLLNACRAFIQLEVEAVFTAANLATS